MAGDKKEKSEAKLAGASWVRIEVRHADGAHRTLEGPFSRKDADELILRADECPNPLLKSEPPK